MAIKVSELPVATTVNNEDYLMVVQNGVSRKATANKVRTGLTIHNEYSDSTIEPYSCKYMNEHSPENVLTTDRLRTSIQTTQPDNYIYTCGYINTLDTTIRSLIPTVMNDWTASTTDVYSCTQTEAVAMDLASDLMDGRTKNTYTTWPTYCWYNIEYINNMITSTYSTDTHKAYDTTYINTLASSIPTVQTSQTTSDSNVYSCTYVNGIASSIPTVQTSTTTSDTNAYSCTYINNLVGDIDTVLTTLTIGGGVQ